MTRIVAYAFYVLAEAKLLEVYELKLTLHRLIRDVPSNDTGSLVHLRRFTKPQYIPTHLREDTPDDALYVILARSSVISKDELACRLKDAFSESGIVPKSREDSSSSSKDTVAISEQYSI